MSEFLQAAILAAIQGCLEFLPISSSGHTFIIARLAGWDQFGLLFDATIHLGSLLAVLYYLFRNISSVERSPKWSVTFKGDDDRIGLARLFVLVVVSTVPLVAFGIAVTLLTDDFGRDPNSVSVTLLVTALVLFIAGILATGQWYDWQAIATKSARNRHRAGVGDFTRHLTFRDDHLRGCYNTQFTARGRALFLPAGCPGPDRCRWADSLQRAGCQRNDQLGNAGNRVRSVAGDVADLNPGPAVPVAPLLLLPFRHIRVDSRDCLTGVEFRLPGITELIPQGEGP